MMKPRIDRCGRHERPKGFNEADMHTKVIELTGRGSDVEIRLKEDGTYAVYEVVKTRAY